MKQLPQERLTIACTAQGAMEGALERTIAYCKERQDFGGPLMQFQNTRFKLAECKTRTMVSRAFLNARIASYGSVPLDAAVRDAVRRREPFALAGPSSPASRAVARVTATPEGEYSPTPTPDGAGFSVIRPDASWDRSSRSFSSASRWSADSAASRTCCA